MSGRVHGTAVAIGEAGVLILGASGSGKSDLALRLIDRGAVLIADDYVEVAKAGERLRLSPPSTIAGRIEVRELGIVALPWRRDVALALVVDLDAERFRLPEPHVHAIEGIAVPRIAIDPRPASAPIKVELALNGEIAALD